MVGLIFIIIFIWGTTIGSVILREEGDLAYDPEKYRTDIGNVMRLENHINASKDYTALTKKYQGKLGWPNDEIVRYYNKYPKTDFSREIIFTHLYDEEIEKLEEIEKYLDLYDFDLDNIIRSERISLNFYFDLWMRRDKVRTFPLYIRCINEENYPLAKRVLEESYIGPNSMDPVFTRKYIKYHYKGELTPEIMRLVLNYPKYISKSYLTKRAEYHGDQNTLVLLSHISKSLE